MRRQRYNTVAASEEAEVEDDSSSNNVDTMEQGNVEASRTSRRQFGGRGDGGASYARIATSTTTNNDETPSIVRANEEEDVDLADIPLAPATSVGNDGPSDSLTVTILDYTHKRWNVSVASKNNSATVLDLKRAGANVHQIPVAQQRLIFRGALLADDKLLSAANITHETVVHLFPKPRVVVVNSNTESSSSNNTSATGTENGSSADDNESGGGARVPTIVYDQDEVERRGGILVLSSMDYIEAVNNVKLFSFMLLIVSSMELLNLAALFMGDGAAVAGVPANSPSGPDPYDTIVPFTLHDDFFDDDKTNDFGNSNSHSAMNNTLHPPLGMDPALALLQTWTPLKYFDVLLSIVGVYVALMGIKASNANCTATAKVYLIGTCLVAAAWLAYNYTMSLHVDQALQTEMENGGSSAYADMYNIDVDEDADVYNEAFQVMILPAMVWCMCIFRAWQFQHLLAEAEAEAAERIAAETANFSGTTTSGSGSNSGAPDIEMTPVMASVSSSPTSTNAASPTTSQLPVAQAVST